MGCVAPPKAPAFVHDLLNSLRYEIESGRMEVSTAVEKVRGAQVRLEPTDLIERLQHFWESALPRLRILCMTTDPVSTTMWAYYGDNRQGIVLEFGELDRTNSPLLEMREVSYQDLPPELVTKEHFARTFLGAEQVSFIESFQQFYYTKSTKWAHETEWRLCGRAEDEDRSTTSDYAFHPRSLRRVIFGPECPITEQNAIVGLLQATRWSHVTTDKAVIDHVHRCIVLKPMEREQGL
jgi:hypothetical protein